MTAVQFRNPERRLSIALAATAEAVKGHVVTLRELLALIGEQGLLVFCAILAAPFLLPISLPFMSAALGPPMMLIGIAVTLNRVPWLPDRLLDRALPAETVQHVLTRVAGWAERVEHLIRPRMLGLTGSAGINVLNGALLVLCVLLLMAPLPLVPFANTLPGVAIMLLALGMAERDGAVVLFGYLAAAVSTVYVGGLMALVIYAGMNAGAALETLRRWLEQSGIT
ncbi:MAG: hypothetical protein AMJ58_02295 [Gammaproteobacteria bacterium SG8_30]|jgi:hypothetical protein|nr:MAG: hypothetical protein AMJ58_02295 [Gammaproteobacteria bacterium SG8_30]